jgi:hypothetical protein
MVAKMSLSLRQILTNAWLVGSYITFPLEQTPRAAAAAAESFIHSFTWCSVVPLVILVVEVVAGLVLHGLHGGSGLCCGLESKTILRALRIRVLSAGFPENCSRANS